MRMLSVIYVALATLAVNGLGDSALLAHQWGRYHWPRCGSSVTIKIRNTALFRAPAEAARNDWENHTILHLPSVNYHTDVSVFDGAFGLTGWSGYARLFPPGRRHIRHAHAVYNYSYFPSINPQGVFCQEIGHTFGLDHSRDGGCMGYTYWPSHGIRTVAHNWQDISNMYRSCHADASDCGDTDAPCPSSPFCGDGTINQGGEQCEPPGSTCANGQPCSEDCVCPAPPTPGLCYIECCDHSSPGPYQVWSAAECNTISPCGPHGFGSLPSGNCGVRNRLFNGAHIFHDDCMCCAKCSNRQVFHQAAGDGGACSSCIPLAVDYCRQNNRGSLLDVFIGSCSP